MVIIITVVYSCLTNKYARITPKHFGQNSTFPNQFKQDGGQEAIWQTERHSLYRNMPSYLSLTIQELGTDKIINAQLNDFITKGLSLSWQFKTVKL